MKKIISIILFLTILFVFCAMASSCNVSVGPGSYSFKKVHICAGGVNKCIEISKWHDNEVGVEVYSETYGALFFSEGTYILVGDKCPICNK